MRTSSSVNTAKNLTTGFTLVELVIVFAIIAIISGISFVSMQGFSDQRQVNVTAADFAASVQFAKSRTQMQVKPVTGSCAEEPLDGYRVTLDCSENRCTGYHITPVCGGENGYSVKSAVFPTNVSVSISSPVPTFMYQVLTGVVDGSENPTVITFSGAKGENAVVRIYYDGRVTQ